MSYNRVVHVSGMDRPLSYLYFITGNSVLIELNSEYHQVIFIACYFKLTFNYATSFQDLYILMLSFTDVNRSVSSGIHGLIVGTMLTDLRRSSGRTAEGTDTRPKS
jgi:hypothetical protein